MDKEELLERLEGMHTVETVAEVLKINKQSALNLLSQLRREEHVTIFAGGGRRKRIYKISMRKQRKRVLGMFDVINKYSPHMKINPWYDHQVHGKYTVEDALIDAIETKSFRVILTSLHLFKHVTDWPRLYAAAKQKGIWQKVGALYDVARMFMKVRRMPERYKTYHHQHWMQLTQLKKKNFPDIANIWKVYISFNKYDVGEAL